MKIVIFGLTLSSSWGNGHATLWRGLCKALARRGHRITFFEHDVPYYAASRDFHELPGGKLIYDNWTGIEPLARQESCDADVTMVTSYCPDAIAATELLLSVGRALRVFYDLNSPVTLARIAGGESVSYIGPRGLADFDLVLSYTGGEALRHLRDRLGAPRAAPLYGHVDPEIHRPAQAQPHYRSDLSYLGTYSVDRQLALEALLVDSARQRSSYRFLIGGAQYPQDFPWSPNIYFVQHLPPSEHPAFYASSRVTLNITRAPMATMGWCPSGRLFEAAACGAPVLSNSWSGLDNFFAPGREILIATTTSEALDAIDLSDAELMAIGRAARERTLAEHTSEHRAGELIALLESADTGAAPDMMEA